MKKSILLSVLLMAGLVHANPFQGQYATSPFVTMFGWNYIRVERIEELGVYYVFKPA